jgi:hypothetical protein
MNFGYFLILFKEWDHFTRTLLSEKSDKKSHVPKWLDSERASDFALLRVILAKLSLLKKE